MTTIRLDLLEMLGRSYIIDHCINQLKRESEETALRVYITDALKAVVENTAKFSGGVTMRRRYADIISHVPEDEETKEQAQERANGIIKSIKDKLQSLGKEEACDEQCDDAVCQADS